MRRAPKVKKQRISEFMEVTPAQARAAAHRLESDIGWKLEEARGDLLQLEKLYGFDDARRHQLEGPHGRLIGLDGGEFFGELSELSKADGHVKVHPSEVIEFKQQRVPANVKSLSKRGHRVLVLRGLAHMGTVGAAELYRGKIGKGLKLEKSVLLPECPSSFAFRKDSIFIPVRLGLLELNLLNLRLVLYEPSNSKGNAMVWRRKEVTNPRALYHRVHRFPRNARSAWQYLTLNNTVIHQKKVYVSAGPAVVELEMQGPGVRARWLIRPGLVPETSPFSSLGSVAKRRLKAEFTVIRGTKLESFRHSAVPQQVVRAYMKTEYLVRAKTPFTVKIGERSMPMWRELTYQMASRAAVLTAWNPFSKLTGVKENKTAQERLVQELEWLGLVYFPALGVDASCRWPAEESVAIIGIDFATAQRLGRLTNQNGFVWIEEEAVPELVLLR
jgi:hypothetical protein